MPRTRIRGFERQPLVCLVEAINILARVARGGERFVGVQDIRRHKTTRCNRTCIWLRRRISGNYGHRQSEHNTCAHCLHIVLRYISLHGHLPFLVFVIVRLEKLRIHITDPFRITSHFSGNDTRAISCEQYGSIAKRFEISD